MGALAQTRPELDVQNRESTGVSEAQRMETVGRLLSGVAHDFNNLLTGIVLCSDLLLGRLEKESPLRRYAQEIRYASAQGASMIHHLLSVARGEASHSDYLPVNQIIAGMLKFLKRLLGENIEVITELADDLPLISMDPAEIQQVVLNLALNARDAMPEGGQIRLRTRNRARENANASGGIRDLVELEIEDTGSGMDAETCDRAPEPFFTTKKRTGTGLGLATVHGIVKKASGTLQLSSQPGRGTRVTVTLPAATRPAGQAQPPADEIRMPFKPRTIRNQEEKTHL